MKYWKFNTYLKVQSWVIYLYFFEIIRCQNWCISYLLCNKLPHKLVTESNKHLLSCGFCELGIWEQLSCMGLSQKLSWGCSQGVTRAAVISKASSGRSASMLTPMAISRPQILTDSWLKILVPHQMDLSMTFLTTWQLASFKVRK